MRGVAAGGGGFQARARPALLYPPILSLNSSVTGSILTLSPVLTSWLTRTLIPFSRIASFMPLFPPYSGGAVSLTFTTTDAGGDTETMCPSTRNPM